MTTAYLISNKSKIKGFTLLEVLIALVVLALAFTALNNSIFESGESQLYRKEKTLAHYVAMYRLNEVKLEEPWPNIGTTRGEIQMAKQNWTWQQQVLKTTESGFRRVEVSVGLERDPDYKLAKVVAFVAEPSEDGQRR
ncbi:type II secretion system minor pseudopilin GspI [Pleionea sediminis]|uniref:type II secretion system minor pseudopilin GspI n=1 Tax=Pleionea sediminis TaxID=2569479 RepID=UPI0011856C76|nr:type II secretion system minor pseudopilin GspI [Pleionea sediminis]